MNNPFTTKDPLLDIINQVVLGEKKLTDAEMKKREEIAKAMERDNPGMDMGKKMAIATAQAKKVAEEVEQIDEDKATYRYTGGMHGEYHPTKKQPSRAAHIDAAKFHEREAKIYSKALGKKGGDDEYANRAIDFHTGAASHHRNSASAMKEEVEQIDEISAELATKVRKAHAEKSIRHNLAGDKGKAAGHIARAIHASVYADKRKADPKAPIKISSKELKHKANELGLNTEEVELNLDEQLENFWGAYLTCLDEAKDDASQQALLLRAMAKDPSDLMKMKRAISMGDKALTNPAMRQEILKMLDQMMNLTVTDKALLQKTRSSFMKQKQFKAVDTTNTEEYVPEEVEELEERNKENAMRRKMMDASRGARYKLANKVVPDREPEHKTAQAHNKAIGRALRNEEVEELDEAKIPVHHINQAVTKVLGTDGAARFATHLRSGTDKHTSWDKVNNALMKQGVKTKHIASVAAHLKPAQYNEEVEELDELSKDTLGNYIKKATTGMNGIAVNAHMSGSASSSEQREKHFDKAFKRGKGIAKAVDKLTKEEVEQIDEISKKTLGSYIKKASGDANDNAVRASWETSRIAVGDPNDPGNHGKANKYIRDLRNRKKGISRATDKLTKEEAEQVDEAGGFIMDKGMGRSAGPAPFEGGREVKSSKPAAERVKKIAKGMLKKYTKKD